jgi:hypothetical protein
MRDLLWLIALVAMGLGWFADLRRRDAEYQAAKLRVEDAEFRVDRARAETRYVREAVFGFRLEHARTNPVKRVEFEKQYPREAKIFFPEEDPE